MGSGSVRVSRDETMVLMVLFVEVRGDKQPTGSAEPAISLLLYWGAQTNRVRFQKSLWPATSRLIDRSHSSAVRRSLCDFNPTMEEETCDCV
jgi:hypothetical protein